MMHLAKLWSFWSLVLLKAIKTSVDATRDEWVDFVQVKSWQRTSGSCEIIKVGILRSYDTEIQKSGEGNRSRMCSRLQTSWSTTPVLDRWHRWMDWDEDQWSGYSSGRSWSLERDTTCRQPFLWRKALNDDDDDTASLRQTGPGQQQVIMCLQCVMLFSDVK